MKGGGGGEVGGMGKGGGKEGGRGAEGCEHETDKSMFSVVCLNSKLCISVSSAFQPVSVGWAGGGRWRLGGKDEEGGGGGWDVY